MILGATLKKIIIKKNQNVAKKIKTFFLNEVFENKRRGPDHQCGPSILCGPIISDGPKVPSLCFIISRKNVKKNKKKEQVFFLNHICSMPIFEICNYDDLRFVSYYSVRDG